MEREKMASNNQSCSVVAVALAAIAATSAEAGLASVVVLAPTAQVQGRWVWSVYLSFTESNDRLVGVNGFQLTGGTMAGVQHRDYGSGTWNPAWNYVDSPSWSGSDSWVSIDGKHLSADENTLLGWPGGGSTIPNGAGWSQQISTSGGASPYNDLSVPGSHEIKIMQIAGSTLAPGSFAFRFSVNVDWRETTNTAIQSTPVTVAIPGPGASVLCTLLTLAAGGRRRRR